MAERLPELNRCWYVDRVVKVRREYGLTMDRAEANAIDRVLAGCESTSLVLLPTRRLNNSNNLGNSHSRP